MIKCCNCKIEKEENCFGLNNSKSGRSTGRQAYCKDCRAEYKRKSKNGELKRIKPEGGKICCECKTLKPFEDFNKTKRQSDGRGTMCRECCIIYRKEYRIKNREKLLQTEKEYYWNTREERLTKSKEYRKKNKEKLKVYNRALRQTPEFKRWENDYKKHRRQTNLHYALTVKLRNRIRAFVKKVYYSESTKELLGCSLEEFQQYFENKFTEGMTWEKFMNGEIHIDHSKPCIAFDLTKPEEIKACFHYTNLQPLWAVDNLRKAAKDKLFKCNYN